MDDKVVVWYAGDFGYLPGVQFLNLGVVTVLAAVLERGGWGLGGIWWSLVVFFGIRTAAHVRHVATHWDDHVLGNMASRNKQKLSV